MQAGESAEFEAVMLPHLGAAYTLARYLVRNDHDAEDVVQDACLRAFTYRAGYRGETPESARAWLLAIVRNTAYTWRRRAGNRAELTEFDETRHGDADPGRGTALERMAARDALERALAALPAEFREVIVLREVEGLSYREISEVVGVPAGTVMSRLSRARERLQRALEPEREGV